MLLHALIWLSILLATTAATQYECLPYPEKTTCIIDFIVYHPGGDPITFPTGYDHYRTTSRSEKQIKPNVTIFDEVIYEAMHRPPRIELVNVQMKQVNLPSELQLGNFAENNLRLVTVTSNRTYQISHLDLHANFLEDITFIGSLVNLEVLYLESNQLSTIPGPALAPLTKLKYLFLQFNSFTSIPWTDLSRTLIHLDCYYDHVESVNFTNVSFPSLEYLNLRHNALATINVTTLLRIAPRLKEAHLHNENMTEWQMDQIKATLRANNISFVDSPWVKGYCFDDDQHEYKDGRCFRRELDQPLRTRMAVLLSAVVIGLAAAFVYIVALAFRHMNR